ncbi:MAG: class I SAM-dependent methyltransferase, partial [Burkholderiales bacterium]|nr:class I SAM-dependent methyltransferase [Anaerolineae bacterium]
MPSNSVTFDRAADYYDETRGFPAGQETPVADMIARVGHLTLESRVLEIGIGTGRIAVPVAHYVRAYYGVDISRPMMNRLRAKQTTEPIYLTEGDATQLPFPDAAFDAIVVVHVFHLIPDAASALRELQRVLRPGGVLLHGHGHTRAGIRELWDAWESINPAPSRGVDTDKQGDFLKSEGWQAASGEQTHEYEVHSAPREFLDQVRRRVWSSSWHMSDEDMARGITAVEAAIAANYGDGSETIPHKSEFYVTPF